MKALLFFFATALLAASLTGAAGCATARHPRTYGTLEEQGIRVEVLDFDQEVHETNGTSHYRTELQYRIANNSGTPISGYEITMAADTRSGSRYFTTGSGRSLEPGQTWIGSERYISTEERIESIRPVSIQLTR